MSLGTQFRERHVPLMMGTSPVFHKTQLHGNVRCNQFSTVWFCTADKAALTAFTGPFCIRHL